MIPLVGIGRGLFFKGKRTPGIDTQMGLVNAWECGLIVAADVHGQLEEKPADVPDDVDVIAAACFSERGGVGQQVAMADVLSTMLHLVGAFALELAAQWGDSTTGFHLINPTQGWQDPALEASSAITSGEGSRKAFGIRKDTVAPERCWR